MVGPCAPTLRSHRRLLQYMLRHVVLHNRERLNRRMRSNLHARVDDRARPNDNLRTNNHSPRVTLLAVRAFSLNRILCNIIGQDSDVSTDPGSGANLNTTRIIDTGVLADEGIVVDANVVPVCTAEAGLDDNTGTQKALLTWCNDESVSFVKKRVKYFGKHGLRGFLAHTAAELASVVVTEKGVRTTLALILESWVKVGVICATDHLRALDVFFQENFGAGFLVPGCSVGRRGSICCCRVGCGVIETVGGCVGGLGCIDAWWVGTWPVPVLLLGLRLLMGRRLMWWLLPLLGSVHWRWTSRGCLS